MIKISFLLIGLCAVLPGSMATETIDPTVLSPSTTATRLKIYHDADYVNHNESAESMRMGFLTALDEVGNRVQGFELELVVKDHRGNSIRSKRHMKQFLEDPQALFVLGGLHSPPYIRNLNYINENGILLLVPWAAGGPITRYAGGDNWVFRLSIDDTKAGFRLAQFAVDERACKKPHLLLEDTPWGKSNYKTMTAAFKQRLKGDTQTTWFNWNTRKGVAKTLLRGIVEQGADCILFVGNAIEGEQFARAMLSLPSEKRLPIISHWGITGANFHEIINSEMRKGFDLFFIQTCFSFTSTELANEATAVFKRARTLFPETLKQPEDIPAPPGFIHAYDLGKIVIAALQSTALSGNLQQDRKSLKQALENLKSPVKGLIKNYNRPFEPWTTENRDAHEALGLEDFCMAYYADDNRVMVLSNTKKPPDKD